MGPRPVVFRDWSESESREQTELRDAVEIVLRAVDASDKPPFFVCIPFARLLLRPEEARLEVRLSSSPFLLFLPAEVMDRPEDALHLLDFLGLRIPSSCCIRAELSKRMMVVCVVWRVKREVNERGPSRFVII